MVIMDGDGESLGHRGYGLIPPTRVLTCVFFFLDRIFIANISPPAKARFLSAHEKEAIAKNVESKTTTIGLVAEWKAFFSNILNYIWACTSFRSAPLAVCPWSGR